jgi:acyl carrier protein
LPTAGGQMNWLMPLLRPGRARREQLREQIAAVWAEVLERERVSPTDDFLALGGNSLQAVRIVGRVEELASVHLSVRSLLETRTVGKMAEHVERAMAAAGRRRRRTRI